MLVQVIRLRCHHLNDGANWATSRWKLQEIVVSRLDTVGAEVSLFQMARLPHHEQELFQRTNAAWHFQTSPGSEWIGEEPLDTTHLDRLIDAKSQQLRKVCSCPLVPKERQHLFCQLPDHNLLTDSVCCAIVPIRLRARTPCRRRSRSKICRP